jgi:hypothetical protein
MPVPLHGRPYSLTVALPPLGVLFLRTDRPERVEVVDEDETQEVPALQPLAEPEPAGSEDLTEPAEPEEPETPKKTT